MKADDYVRIADGLLKKPPLLSTIWTDVPPGEDGPADEQDIVFEVLKRLMNEVKVIAEARKARTDVAILSIMKELRQKWFAICDRMERPLFERGCFDRFCKVWTEKTEARQAFEKGQRSGGAGSRRPDPT